MFITAIPNRNSRPAILLREGYREDGKVKMRTLANLSDLPPEKIAALKAALKGEAVGGKPVVESSLPHGHVLAVTGMMDQLGLAKLLFGKRHHLRELALALVAGRVIAALTNRHSRRLRPVGSGRRRFTRWRPVLRAYANELSCGCASVNGAPAMRSDLA